MNRVLVVGEDALCCALGERLVAASMPAWSLATAPIDKRGITKLVPDLPRFIEQARHVQPVLCIADTDGRCAVQLRHDWLPAHLPAGFHLRFAVIEAESWVLADRPSFANHFEVPLNRIPYRTDDIDDPKRLVLSLLSRSRVGRYREEMVSFNRADKPGPGYNLHLCDFVRTRWDHHQARTGSDSLDRALLRLDAFCQVARMS